MSASVAADTYRPAKRDYSLIGRDAQLAVEIGLSAAEWYHTDSAQADERTDEAGRLPCVRDTLVWLAALILSGGGGAFLWGSWWCVPFFLVYGVLYGSSRLALARMRHGYSL